MSCKPFREGLCFLNQLIIFAFCSPDHPPPSSPKGFGVAKELLYKTFLSFLRGYSF